MDIFKEVDTEAINAVRALLADARETRNEVIECKARIAFLEEALRTLACFGNGDKPGNSDGNMIARRALGI